MRAIAVEVSGEFGVRGQRRGHHAPRVSVKYDFKTIMPPRNMNETEYDAIYAAAYSVNQFVMDNTKRGSWQLDWTQERVQPDDNGGPMVEYWSPKLERPLLPEENSLETIVRGMTADIDKLPEMFEKVKAEYKRVADWAKQQGNIRLALNVGSVTLYPTDMSGYYVYSTHYLTKDENGNPKIDNPTTEEWNAWCAEKKAEQEAKQKTQEEVAKNHQTRVQQEAQQRASLASKSRIGNKNLVALKAQAVGWKAAMMTTPKED